jgi:hypothetical protein
MTFELPQEPADIATNLRELESTAPNVTPKVIRAALIQAAKEIEDWRALALTHARTLEEAAALRVGMMDSLSKADEVSRQVKLAMTQTAQSLRHRLAR